jgi:hypothetical protein
MSTVKVDAAAWQTVVASICREWDGKGILQESGPGISPTLEPISGTESGMHTFKIADIDTSLSDLLFIFFCCV